MIQTKKRSVSSSENGAFEKPVKKLKEDTTTDKPKAKTPKKDGTVKSNFSKPAGKFQKKTTAPSSGKPGEKVEKKPFVANTPESKKEYWNGLKAKQKELRQQRRQNKSKELYELSVSAKKIYEKLKRKAAENKEELVQKLHELLSKENAYAKIATSHDTARVIQCMIKNASEEIRDQIASSLMPGVVDLATSKYGHHCVTSLFKHGSKLLWARVVDAIIKDVLKMVNHTFSSAIVDSAYNEYATNEQRNFMRQAFYSELFKLDKDRTVQTMKDCWKTNAYMKPSVLSTVKGHLVQAANKKLTDNSLLHALLVEFLEEAGTTERSEVMELYLPLLASISSTRDGTGAAIYCFLHSVVKDRRAALKAMKPYIEKLSIHEHGHRLIMCILNCYDDTVTLGKQVISPIMEQLETIVGSGEWGRKVVGWIFSPDDKDLLHPTQIELLNGYLEHSKKDKEIRRKEVFAVAKEPFCKQIESNASFWLRGGHTALLTASILKKFQGEELARLHRALAKVICDPNWKVHENEINLDGSILSLEVEKKPKENVTPGAERKIKKIKKSPFEEEKAAAREKQLATNPLVNGLEHAGIHIALKKMIKQDQEKRQQGGEDVSQFGFAIVEELTVEHAASWIAQNRSSFLLLLIFENSTEEVQQMLRKKLAPLKKELKAQKHTGGKLLGEKLKL
ncbi:protein penguin [Anopheles maculipalpis]|uniref:protein penguin n=1 Tax=Anopheles maculipalpis TaxID=1496333 RepID=UPI0021596B9A|nr:protein penguin [Anopheles maculipalpis]